MRPARRHPRQSTRGSGKQWFFRDGGGPSHGRSPGSEGQGEGRVGMHARPDRIGLPRKVAAQTVRDEGLQRAQRRRPSLDIGIAAPAKFGREGEQPGPAVGPLECSAAGRSEIVQFCGKVFRGKVAVEGPADPRGRGQQGVEPEDARQRPMPVHRGMPVIASIKGGMHVPRLADVLSPVHQVHVHVRPLALHPCKRQAGKLRRKEGRKRSCHRIQNL